MKRIIAFLFFWFYLPMVQAGLNLQVDNFQVKLGETFRIMLTLDGAQQDEVPDLTPLEENFEIVGTERSSNYSVVNGRAQSNSRWLVTLIAKQPGKVIIPPIRVGTEQTQATTIDITTGKSQSSTPVDTQAEVMLTTGVTTSKPYVNQQVIYTVKLFNSRRLLDAEYQPPQVEDALLVPLGSGQSSQVAANGQIYTVEEQQYAIFPQKSGTLKIKPPAFSALVYDVSPRKIHVQAEETTLDVQAVPAKFTSQYWLPAKQVILSEKYDRQGSNMLQGNTLIRSITLEAVGTPAQLLPALNFASSDKFSVYPETPTMKNSVRNNELVGATTIKMTYLLNQAGHIIIPALKIPWFNTVTGKMETASLPALELDVAAVNKGDTTAASQNDSTAVVKSSEPTPKSPPAASSKSAYLAWGLAGGLLLLWVLTLLLFWRKPAKLAGKKQLFEQLQRACRANDPAAAKAALIQWGNWQWPDKTIMTLADINQLTADMRLKKAINELVKVLYYSEQETWQGDELLEAVTRHQVVSQKKSSLNTVLPELYP